MYHVFPQGVFRKERRSEAVAGDNPSRQVPAPPSEVKCKTSQILRLWKHAKHALPGAISTACISRKTPSLPKTPQSSPKPRSRDTTPNPASCGRK